MIRPDNDVYLIVQQIAQRYPQFVEFLKQNSQVELEKFPSVSGDNLTVMQGRCQAFQEIAKLFVQATDKAQNRRGSKHA